MHMDNSSQLHSRRLAIAFILLGCLVCLLVAGSYFVAGPAAASSLAAAFLMLGAFSVWVVRRAKAWRTANPSAHGQSIPFAAFGGLKTLALVVIVTTFVVALISALTYALGI